MPQALQTLSLIQFWGCDISLFPLLALWGNKNGLPSMEVKEVQQYQIKRADKAANGAVRMPKAVNPL